ncbi:MAG: tRNA uridine-5-carboxymethylaminomethyl(34) synthesis GTPase MnmE [Paracoccus sp. (in: a-proteobacteria)]
MNTIFAEATPPGRGGVSIIRLSGPEARQVTEELAGPLPEVRHCYFRTIKDDDDLIDQALVVRFDHEASFTGEESSEFHLHGAPVVVRRLEEALRRRGLRQAEPGEFTMRSLISGKMNLTDVEGLSDLLLAETEIQRKLAVERSSGALGHMAERWGSDLIKAGAMITASIDFADEEIPEDVADDVGLILQQVRNSLEKELAGYPASERLKRGFEVAIIGAPNAGKSSLMNAIARRDIAIVTDRAGTTRDVVEFRADLRGIPVTFLDTAGIRKAVDQIEEIGIDRARDRALSSDLRIFLGPIPEMARDLVRERDFHIETKGDLTGSKGAISSLTGVGIDDLLDKIFDVLKEKISGAGLAGNERQAVAIADAAAALLIDDNLSVEILSENIREAVYHLRRLVGKIDIEDYLDQVFSTFCIGK